MSKTGQQAIRSSSERAKERGGGREGVRKDDMYLSVHDSTTTEILFSFLDGQSQCTNFNTISYHTKPYLPATHYKCGGMYGMYSYRISERTRTLVHCSYPNRLATLHCLECCCIHANDPKKNPSSLQCPYHLLLIMTNPSPQPSTIFSLLDLV